jgi:transglutaminase-like putative cysteine protease
MVRIKVLLDLLASVVALVSMGPVLVYLDRPLLVVALLAIPTGFWCDRRERYPLPTWLATLLALGGLAFYAMQVTRADVALPVVHAVVVLLIVRLLRPKANRDYLQIFVLSLFILAGSSLIHLEIGFVFYLVLLIFGVTLGLVLLTVHVTDRKLAMKRADLVKLVRIGLLLPAVSLLLMMLFFVILPRTSRPLWNFLNPTAKATVGLSEEVQPGSFSGISTNRALAFRAEGPELPQEERYWRALVLNQSEGGRWIRQPPPREGPARAEGPAPVLFTIYPEPRRDRYLVTLDRPTLASGVRYSQSVDQMFVARSALDHRIRFEVQASPGARLKVLGQVDRNFYLKAPADASSRMRQVAAGIRDQGRDSTERIGALAEFFRRQQLTYAQDALPTGTGAIDAFLFDKKRGYCEFFASAYVTMARLAGIPARLVGGYYGGDYNPFGGYYLVSEDAAHIWAEVLTSDNRWQRVDPSQWAINASLALGRVEGGGLSILRQLADSLNYQWVQAVVVFDLARQISMLHEAGKSLRDLPRLRLLPNWWQFAAGVLVVLVLLTGVVILRRRSREARLLEQLKSRLGKRYGKGLIRPGAGLAELGERLGDEACREFARIYYGAVFRDRPLTVQEYQQLRRLLKEI